MSAPSSVSSIVKNSFFHEEAEVDDEDDNLESLTEDEDEDEDEAGSLRDDAVSMRSDDDGDDWGKKEEKSPGSPRSRGGSRVVDSDSDGDDPMAGMDVTEGVHSERMSVADSRATRESSRARSTTREIGKGIKEFGLPQGPPELGARVGEAPVSIMGTEEFMAALRSGLVLPVHFTDLCQEPVVTDAFSTEEERALLGIWMGITDAEHTNHIMDMMDTGQKVRLLQFLSDLACPPELPSWATSFISMCRVGMSDCLKLVPRALIENLGEDREALDPGIKKDLIEHDQPNSFGKEPAPPEIRPVHAITTWKKGAIVVVNQLVTHVRTQTEAMLHTGEVEERSVITIKVNLGKYLTNIQAGLASGISCLKSMAERMAFLNPKCRSTERERVKNHIDEFLLEKLKDPYAIVENYIEKRLAEDSRRHMGDTLYREVYTEEGHRTYAWEEAGTITEYVHAETQRFKDPYIYGLCRKRARDGIRKDVIERMKLTDDPFLFPKLRMDNDIFSFPNAIVSLADMDTFWLLDGDEEGDPAGDDPKEASAEDEKEDIEDDDAFGEECMEGEEEDQVEQILKDMRARKARPPSNLAACNYIKAPLNVRGYIRALRGKDPMKALSTPLFDSILKAQHATDEEIRVIKAFMGRMLHPTGRYDGWQVAMYVWGVAGAGKSLIVRLLHKMVQTKSAALLSSNQQKKFGMSSLLKEGIRMVLGLDIGEHTAIAPEDIQSMISGEAARFAVKNKDDAVTYAFPHHLWLNSNSPIPFKNVNGNIDRRFINYKMLHRVPENLKRADLFDVIVETELADLLVQCNMLYRQMASKHGTRSIWAEGVLPTSFHEQRRKMAGIMNPLTLFLRPEEGYLDFSDPSAPDSEQYSMPWWEFTKYFSDFCRQSGFQRVRLSSDDTYSLSFRQAGIKRVADQVIGCRRHDVFMSRIDTGEHAASGSGVDCGDDFGVEVMEEGARASSSPARPARVAEGRPPLSEKDAIRMEGRDQLLNMDGEVNVEKDDNEDFGAADMMDTLTLTTSETGNVVTPRKMNYRAGKSKAQRPTSMRAVASVTPSRVRQTP